MIIKASASITLTRVDDGDDGKGIKSIVNKYLASSSGSNVTTATSGWTDSIQTITTGKRYLWNYEVITYTDNSTTTTTPVIIGVYGNTGSTGATGNGISSITEYYLVSPNKSGVTTSTSGWSTTIPTMTATNKYLWNYEVIKYTNSTTSTGTPKVIGIYGDKGDKGDKGETGVGISTVDIEYYLSTSSTAQSGGSWSTTAPTWVDGKYMWSRTKTVTTAGKTTYSNPVCITGGKGNTGATGATGATGKGVSSITEEYYLSTSKTTQSGGSWVTTPPTWSSGKYMWTRSKIVYTNPASTVYTAPVCDSSWEAVNEIDIGGRNLALKTSSSYSTAFSSFSGVTNTCASVGTVLTDGLKAGDTITIRMIYKYTDIVAATGQTAQCWIQGSGNVTEWSSGKFDSSPHLTISGSGEYEFLYNIKITADHVKNSKWSVNIRHDYVQSGSVQFRMFKVEKGNKATDWSPAPEDVDNRLTSAEQKITPEAILSSVNTQISAGGQINTVSTILDKTGFTVKNGAIKIQNKAGSTVLSGDTNGNLVMSGSINVNTQNSQQLYVNTSDSKSPILVSQSKGTYCQSLAVTNDFLAWNNENAWSGVSIKPSGISTPNLNASSISTNGTITASIVHATSNGQGTNFKVGNDCWIGDINQANTMSVKGVSNSNAAYIKLGAGGKIGHNGSGGAPIDLVGNTWVEGVLTASDSLRAANKLYFTRSDTGYWLQARWLYNRYSIEAPNFTGNGLLSNDKIYLRSKSSYGGMILDTGGYFYPEQNNGVSIGHPNGYRISTLYYTNLSAASDLKLKENISYINTSDNQTMSVDEVINTKDFYTFVKDELRLATFDYKTVDKDEQSNRGKIGFIAQDISETKVGKHLLKADEIKQIDLVDVDKMILDEGETVLSYDLTDYVNVLAGALQEATKKIETLEKLNLELETRLKVLENLII